MKHFILTGHARISEGIASAVELILGKKILYFNAYVDNSDKPFYESIKKEIESIDKNDEIIIFTDIFGGSVNNEMMQLLSLPNIHLISGMNLGLVIQFLMTDDDTPIEENINQYIESAKNNIIYCNNLVKNQNSDCIEEF